MNTRIIAAATTAVLLVCLAGCGGKTCTQPTGAWTNREGQSYVFSSEGKGLWLTRFGTSYDTVSFNYQIDCKKDPTAIDMKGFNTGPHEGKSLYGIIEMSTDSSFRLRYESGADPSVRPIAFDADQTMKFYRK